MQPLLDAEGRLRNGWRVLGFLGLFLMAGLAVSLLTHLWPRALRPYVPTKWLMVVGALAASWLCLHLEDRPWASLGLRFNGAFLRDLALGTLGGAALIGAAAALAAGAGAVHWVRTPGVSAGDLGAAVSLFLAVAAFEELLFRGYPFQRAVDGLGFTGAQIVFALLFAFLHWSNPGMTGASVAWGTLNIALAAVLLGFCWHRTGSLALPIGVHLGWNWTQGSLLGLGVSGTASQGWLTPLFHARPVWLSGGTFGLEASLPCALVCSAAILFLWRWKGWEAGLDEGPSGGASTASGS